MTNLPRSVLSAAVVEVLAPELESDADASGAPKDRPLTMVAAASPAAPMDLRAKEALFL
jgi:hypothetical protein